MGKNLKKKAVVIGATGNLGREICKELKKLNFDIDQTWTSKKRPDVLSKNAFKKLPKKIHTAIYVAGINKVCPFTEFSPEEFKKVMDINLNSAINFFRSAFRGLKNARGSNCIVISSIMVTHPYPNRVPYAISKSALETLMKCLCIEWGKYKISTHSIRLGHLSGLMKTTKTNPKLLKNVKKITPLNKLMSNKETSKYIAFLSDGACESVSGGVTEMDSGYTSNRWPL